MAEPFAPHLQTKRHHSSREANSRRSGPRRTGAVARELVHKQKRLLGEKRRRGGGRCGSSRFSPDKALARTMLATLVGHETFAVNYAVAFLLDPAIFSRMEGMTLYRETKPCAPICRPRPVRMAAADRCSGSGQKTRRARATGCATASATPASPRGAARDGTPMSATTRCRYSRPAGAAPHRPAAR